ncbi:MAG: HD domain-containing protein [Candidatus Hodarchaeales archaeon]|jgi:uncharacterized protein
MNYREAIILMINEDCDPDVIYHAIQVSRMAEYIGKRIKENGIDVNIKLITIGGLLHDIGRSKTHELDHGVEGGKILRTLGEVSLAEIAERHIGSGFPRKEAIRVNLPNKDYLPVTLEQKIVCYADKLFQYHLDRDYRIISFTVEKDASMEIKKLKEKLGSNHESHHRLLKLEEELTELVGELPGTGFKATTDHFKP